ncbi:hypothetical protein AB0L06_15450 [Spirillospora sp. NPDC052269]
MSPIEADRWLCLDVAGLPVTDAQLPPPQPARLAGAPTIDRPVLQGEAEVILRPSPKPPCRSDRDHPVLHEQGQLVGLAEDDVSISDEVILLVCSVGLDEVFWLSWSGA